MNSSLVKASASSRSSDAACSLEYVSAGAMSRCLSRGKRGAVGGGLFLERGTVGGERGAPRGAAEGGIERKGACKQGRRTVTGDGSYDWTETKVSGNLRPLYARLTAFAFPVLAIARRVRSGKRSRGASRGEPERQLPLLSAVSAGGNAPRPRRGIGGRGRPPKSGVRRGRTGHGMGALGVVCVFLVVFLVYLPVWEFWESGTGWESAQV